MRLSIVTLLTTLTLLLAFSSAVEALTAKELTHDCVQGENRAGFPETIGLVQANNATRSTIIPSINPRRKSNRYVADTVTTMGIRRLPPTDCLRQISPDVDRIPR